MSNAINLNRRRALAATTILSSSLCFAIPAGAQQLLDPVNVVTSATTVPTSAEKIGSSVSVVTGQEIERDQRRTVPDLLSALPGLNVVQSGGPGSQTSVFIRGTNSNQVKVFVDGVIINDPAFGAVDFGNLLTGDIERVEVLRGPQSGLYGADAIGGVISITTKRGSGPPKVSASLEGGSFGTFNQTASASGSYNKFDYAFNVTHYRTTDNPVTPLSLLPPGRARINDLYDNLTVSTRVGAEVNENLRFNYMARYTDATLRFTSDEFDLNTFATVPRARQDQQHVTQFLTRAEAVWTALEGNLVSTFGADYFEQRTENVSPDPTNSRNVLGDRTRVDWRSQYTFMPGQILIAGAEHQIDRFSKTGFAADMTNTAGFLELQSQPWERAFVAANVRYDDNDRYGGHTTWRVAPSYTFAGTETKLKGSAGTGFKAPTLSQLYENFPEFFFFANPNLKPEESLGYDFGFEQPLAGGLLRVGATYFHNDLTNLIATDPTFTTLINIGRATTYGAEAFATVALTERLKVRVDYTYTRTRDETTGEELLRRPMNKTSLTTVYNPTDPLTLSATVVYVGEFADIDRLTFQRITNPGYFVVNLAGNYQVNQYTKVFARIDNALNEKYQNPDGFLRPGLGVFAGIRVTN